MGRNKFSQREIDIICKLLKRRLPAIVVDRRWCVILCFNISDFNVQGQPFGPKIMERISQQV